VKSNVAKVTRSRAVMDRRRPNARRLRRRSGRSTTSSVGSVSPQWTHSVVDRRPKRVLRERPQRRQVRRTCPGTAFWRPQWSQRTRRVPSRTVTRARQWPQWQTIARPVSAGGVSAEGVLTGPISVHRPPAAPGLVSLPVPMRSGRPPAAWAQAPRGRARRSAADKRLAAGPVHARATG